ncbi:MAG TPA: BTAD domain-containing putative transcriptional regulator [Acidimicrobiales bacterium]|nr:BTAD domain-containing putative transcriptional regulator [Acidimicrobiales bacterium]
MSSNRLRRYSDALCVLACEIVAFAFFLRASTLLGTVDFSHFGKWLQATNPQVALTAMFRLLGLAISGWLLLSTLLYAVAALSGKRAIVAKSRLITLPVLRRVVDSVAAASVAASSIGSAAAVSSAAPFPHNSMVVRSVDAGQRQQTAPAHRATNVLTSAPARVSSTAIGRHFPHPGRVHHDLPQAAPVEARSEVPSAQNGFAGLPQGTKVVVVQPGDCLSVLAERHLGDWRLDSEIEALNYGRRQPDGRALVDDHWIYVGWVLVMPPDAVGTIVVGETSRPAQDAVIRSGPSSGRGLSPTSATSRPPTPSVVGATAQPSVRTAAAAGSLFGARQEAKPAASPPAGRQSARTAPETSTERSGSRATGPTTTVTQRTDEVPVTDGSEVRTTPDPASVAPGSLGQPKTAPSPSSPPTTTKSDGNAHDPQEEVEGSPYQAQRDSQQQAGDDARLAFAATIGAITGGSVVWGLDRARRRFAHARPKDGPIPRSRTEVEAAERRARAVSDPEKTRWVDQALRYLSGLIEEVSLEGTIAVPSLALVRIGAVGLEVFVSPGVNSSLGWFSPTHDGSTLVLDPDVTLEELEALAEDRWPAWPALVSVGETKDGELLLNLEHAGSVSVEGSKGVVTGVLGRMVLELSSQPWSDEMLAGLYILGDSPLEPLQGVENVAADEALDLAEKLDTVSGAQQELAGSLSISALRAVACEALPNVVLAFAGAPAAALQCLAEAAVPEQSGVALAGAGPYHGARWRLVVSEDGQGTLEGQLAGRPMSFTFMTGCVAEEVPLLGEALGTASNIGGNGRGVEPGDAGSAAEPLADARGNGSGGLHRPGGEHLRNPDLLPPERGDVEICVLGPVDIVGGNMSVLEPSRRMAALALLAYMATHERPITADEITSALWPLDAEKDNLNGPQRKTVMNAISRARAVLSYSASGKERIAYSPQGYRLASDVTSDWKRFEKYLANARQQSPGEAIASLRKALELVRGEPFGGALSSQFFEWVASEHLDMTFSAKVVDAAEDLGQMALDLGDLEAVVWAVEKGLQLEPTREGLFRLWMHALGREGRPAKVDDVYRRLKMVLRQRIHSLQEPQPETREVWRRYTAAEFSGSQG